MAERLIEADDFLIRADRGMPVELALPFKCANGYFVRGYDEKSKVYATIPVEERDRLDQLLKQNKPTGGKQKWQTQNIIQMI